MAAGWQFSFWWKILTFIGHYGIWNRYITSKLVAFYKVGFKKQFVLSIRCKSTEPRRNLYLELAIWHWAIDFLLPSTERQVNLKTRKSVKTKCWFRGCSIAGFLPSAVILLSLTLMLSLMRPRFSVWSDPHISGIDDLHFLCTFISQAAKQKA